jgi:hypothetical protein
MTNGKLHTYIISNELGFWKHPSIVEKKKKFTNIPPVMINIQGDGGAILFRKWSVWNFDCLWVVSHCRTLKSDWWRMNYLINVKQWVRNLSKSVTNSTFFKFYKFAWPTENYAYLSKKQWAWILKAPKHSWEKNLQTGSANATIFAFLDEDLGSLHFLFTIFYFFSTMLGCFQNPKLIALDK